MNCENCGDTIGRRETPFVWGDHCVCPPCYKRLSMQSAPAVIEAEELLDEPEPIEETEPIDELARQIVPARRVVDYSGYGRSGYARGDAPIVHHIHHETPGRRKGRELMITGAILMACSIPLMCFYGLGLIVFPVGLILFIVGACL